MRLYNFLPLRRGVALALAASCSIALAAQNAGDAARVQTEALSRRVNDRVRALQAEATRLAGQTKTMLGDLRALEIERDLQREHANQAGTDAAAAQASLAQTTAHLTELEQQRDEQLPDLSARLVELYKHGRGSYVQMLLSVRDLRELGRATRAVSSLVHMNESRVAEHRRIIASLRQAQAALEEKAREMKTLQGEAQGAREAAERAVAARTNLIAEIDRRRDLNAQLLGELATAQQQLDASLANLRTGRPGEPVAIPLRAFRGTLDWPVVGPVRSRFGKASSRTPDGTTASGIEIDAPEGTPVRAIHGGTVGFADTFSGYGTLVIVDHGGNQFSLYGYLGSVSVERDRRVEAGQDIGRVGLAPAGPAGLYLELRVDGRSVDPLQWLKPR